MPKAKSSPPSPPRDVARDVVRDVPQELEALCAQGGMRMTEQRRVIARVLAQASHPDVAEVHRRAHKIDPQISIATVYRTVRLFVEAGILHRHEFGDGRARYEPVPDEHHDHLIDVETGKVMEFTNDEIERLQEEIAARLGYRLVDHRLELYGIALDGRAKSAAQPPSPNVSKNTKETKEK